MKAGLTSGITSGIIGGISNGMAAEKIKGNYWTGEGAIVGEYVIPSKTSSGTEHKPTMADYARAAEYNEPTNAQANSDTYLLNLRTRKEFDLGVGDYNVSDITTRPGPYAMDASGYYLNSNGKVGGFLQYEGNGLYSMHISPEYALGSSITNFKAVVGHEWIHAIHHSLVTPYVNRWSEHVAYQYAAHIYQSANDIYNAAYNNRQALKYLWAPQSYYTTLPKSLGGW
jgi:hypothetical protein